MVVIYRSSVVQAGHVTPALCHHGRFAAFRCLSRATPTASTWSGLAKPAQLRSARRGGWWEAAGRDSPRVRAGW